MKITVNPDQQQIRNLIRRFLIVGKRNQILLRAMLKDIIRELMAHQKPTQDFIRVKTINVNHRSRKEILRNL